MPRGVYARTDEYRAKMSAAISPQVRAKMADARRGKPMSPESIAKAVAARTGMRLGPLSAEHRAKIGAANRRRVVSPETRAKLAARNATRVVTDESRAKASIAQKGKPKSPEHRANLSAATKGRVFSNEHKQKISDSINRGWENGRHAIRPVAQYTPLARALHSHLTNLGLSLEPEVRFGRYTLDLYDRLNHTAYEADGKYWHDKNETERPGYHARRDAYLTDKHGLKVVHFTDAEIRGLRRAVA
jgi:hypothetical protein